MRGIGTIVNIAAVIIGSGIGLVFKGGLKKRYQEMVMQALGVSTIFVGAAGVLTGMFQVNGATLQMSGSMVLVVSLVIGSLLGEWINIEMWLERFGDWLKEKASSKGDIKFTEAFVTASLIMCVGGMAIVGPLQDAMGNPAMLYTKAALDGILALTLATTLGKGVIFSAIPLGILQGSVTLLAQVILPVLTEQMKANLSFVGSALVFCVGINLVFGKKLKVGNMLPALLCAVICAIFIKG